MVLWYDACQVIQHIFCPNCSTPEANISSKNGIYNRFRMFKSARLPCTLIFLIVVTKSHAASIQLKPVASIQMEKEDNQPEKVCFTYIHG